MMLNTRAKQLQLMKKLYSEVGYKDSQVEYLVKKGLRSPSALTEAYRQDDSLTQYVHDTEFPSGEVSVLCKLAQYLLWTIDTVGNYTVLEANFTSDAFDTFQPDRVLKNADTKISTVSTTKSSSGTKPTV